MAPLDKQLAANRASAAKSSGAKTGNGKRNSSRHGTGHGTLASVQVLESESRPLFHQLLNSFETEFVLNTPTGHLMVEYMATSQWRLIRRVALESASVRHEWRRQRDTHEHEVPAIRAMLAFRELGNNSRYPEFISRYEVRYDRQKYDRALREPAPFSRRKNAGRQRSHQLHENKEIGP